MLFYLADMVIFHRKLAKSLTTRRVASIPPGRPDWRIVPPVVGYVFHEKMMINIDKTMDVSGYIHKPCSNKIKAFSSSQ